MRSLPARRHAVARALLAVAALGALALGQDPPDAITLERPSPVAYATAPWLTGVRLPVAVVLDPARPDRALVVLLEGQVLEVVDGDAAEVPFLDLRHRITGREGEQGLFSVALEPPERAAARGRAQQAVAVFTEVGTGDVVVAAYPIDPTSGRADASREVVVFRVPVDAPFHHGGQARFGPDGLLYVAIGNGASPAELPEPRPWSAQALDSWRGKVLRVDLLPALAGDGPTAYAVPEGNPFLAEAARDEARPEVWSLGFRNPWKFTFDPASGDLVLVDVGADRYEEVNRVAAGANHGWPIREGRSCLAWPDRPGLVDPDCAERPLADPWIAYGHPSLDPTGGTAVVGGAFVTDPALPELRGAYVFGDFTGRVWAVPADGDGARVRLLDGDRSLTGVDVAPDGAVLLVDLRGEIVRLVHAPGGP
jgi:glucose/arabinose dehydrogenase